MEPQGISDPSFVPTIIEPKSLGIPNDSLGTEWLTGHAELFWKAEEANATRVSGRANLVLSGILAIIGLKLYTAGREVETLLSPQAGWIGRVSLALCAVAFLFLFITLLLVLSIRFKKSRGPASTRLMLPDELADRPWAMTERQAAWYVFRKTHNAAKDLHERNKSREKVVEKAQILFLAGVFALFIALGLYAAIVYNGARGVPVSDGHQNRGSEYDGDSLEHQDTQYKATQ